jgi:D-serine deaminase-like pyridoxal phosphate-dependent protein
LVDGDEPAADHVIVDAGFKALAFVSGIRARRAPSTSTEGRLSAATNRFGLGDKIQLNPCYCDPTVNPYDRFFCVRGNCDQQLWPITAAAGRKRPPLSGF